MNVMKCIKEGYISIIYYRFRLQNKALSAIQSESRMKHPQTYTKHDFPTISRVYAIVFYVSPNFPTLTPTDGH